MPSGSPNAARLRDDRLGTATEPGNWRHRAACRGMDTDLFIPTNRGDRTGQARMICHSCPVAIQCLNDALCAGPDLCGIWGGTSQKQRRNILRHRTGQQRTPVEHGTSSGYRRHREDDEEPCAACRAAEAERVAAGRAARAELQPCGTTAAYMRHLRNREVPCEPCRIAQAAKSATRRKAAQAA